MDSERFDIIGSLLRRFRDEARRASNSPGRSERPFGAACINPDLTAGIAERILEAIGVATTVVNVGAGSGSYEPVDKRVVAVEPSATMILQRPRGGAPAVQATAERLPFEADAFDCGLAVLTVHHWADPLAGLRELRSVARNRVVVLTWDQNLWERFWLVAEYLPALASFRPPPGDSSGVDHFGLGIVRSTACDSSVRLSGWIPWSILETPIRLP